MKTYEFSNGDWSQIGQSLIGDDFDYMFGSKVSISDDGTVISATSPGATGENNGAYIDIKRGNVRVFKLGKANSYQLKAIEKYKNKYVDKITNFTSSIDSIKIRVNSFGLDEKATFSTANNKKKVKNKYANTEVDFIDDKKQEGFYFNENGTDKGFGDWGILAILKGAPKLTTDDIQFI